MKLTERGCCTSPEGSDTCVWLALQQLSPQSSQECSRQGEAYVNPTRHSACPAIGLQHAECCESAGCIQVTLL